MDGLTAGLEKMERAGLPEIARQTFADYYRRLAAGEQGMLHEADIEPVATVVDAETLPAGGEELLDQAIVLKLNGGLGTGMGMTGPKSLIEAREDHTFLDVTVRQVLHLRERSGARVPLVLMNSFRTRDESLAALGRHPEIESDVPLDFVQGKVPKLRADDLTPVEWAADPELEWAPPGHGDLYTSLVGSGLLEALLSRGYRYAFVSNSDNLGAVLDPRILAWLAREELPFAMEVADRTEADRKGGHVAQRPGGGGLILRETAQISEDDRAAFEDVTRHRYFNANTLWVDLQALASLLDRQDGVLGLPMIVNRKTVDPGDPSSPAVIQLESAMGAAIGVFEGAAAVRIPRSRFVPVKTTNDLLSLRSDAYAIGDDWQVSLVPARGGQPPVIDLDADHFKLLASFEERFSDGPPSLVECERLTVNGDVSFGRGVTVRGAVVVDGPARIEDGAVLAG